MDKPTQKLGLCFQMYYQSFTTNASTSWHSKMTSSGLLSDVIKDVMVIQQKNARYHRQQNKCYPKAVYLSVSKPQSFLAVANLFSHNIIS